jgi:aspartate dehydrogenase
VVGVGIIGCGAIGSEIALAVCDGKAPGASLVGLLDQEQNRAISLTKRLRHPVPTFATIAPFVATPGLQMVVECASPTLVRACAEDILLANKDLLVMSSGAMADITLFERLSKIAVEQGRRLLIPSGAIGGIDAIRAARDHLEQVTLTTTKPPRGLSGSPGFRPWEDTNLDKAQVIFEGSAIKAIELFPANINVAITLSLAGIGPHRTNVKIIADPTATVNIHEIHAIGDFGDIRITLRNKPHPRNAHTSHLAVLSAIEILRVNCSDGARIGT